MVLLKKFHFGFSSAFNSELSEHICYALLNLMDLFSLHICVKAKENDEIFVGKSFQWRQEFCVLHIHFETIADDKYSKTIAVKKVKLNNITDTQKEIKKMRSKNLQNFFSTIRNEEKITFQWIFFSFTFVMYLDIINAIESQRKKQRIPAATFF